MWKTEVHGKRHGIRFSMHSMILAAAIHFYFGLILSFLGSARFASIETELPWKNNDDDDDDDDYKCWYGHIYIDKFKCDASRERKRS